MFPLQADEARRKTKDEVIDEDDVESSSTGEYDSRVWYPAANNPML